MLVLASNMRCHQPGHVVAQIAIVMRPQNQVKMVWHQTVTEQAHRRMLAGLHEESDESNLFGVLEQDSLVGVASLEDRVTGAALA